MNSKKILTGITTTGTPHLGNYVGAIRPAIASSKEQDHDSFLFLADYHALIKNNDKRPRTNRTSERLMITETDEETIFRFSVLFFLLFIMFAKI